MTEEIRLRRATIDDAFRKPADRRLRRLPGLVQGAFLLVWSAARKELLATIALQVISGAGISLQVVLGGRALTEILAAERRNSGVTTVMPELAVLFGATAITAVAIATRQELQALLSEIVGRHAQDRIIDIAIAVDLEAYENPQFLDRLQRAQVSASSRPHRMTSDFVSLIGAGIGIIALLVAMLALEPLLVPAVLLGYGPVWLVLMRNGRLTHAFSIQMTPRDRKRSYLAAALTGKPFAQELRVFGCAAYLRREHDRFYEERIGELRKMIRQRMRHTVLASTGTALLLAANIGFLIVLFLAGRVSVAEGLAAAVAVQQLGGRLSSITFSGSMLYENALFLDDFDAFLSLAPSLSADRPAGAAPASFSTLTLDSVSFSYPGTGRLALESVSLDIRAGEVCALVGENGSGKTTLAKLLCHLYTPTSGRILWDGVDVAGSNPEELRKHVSVVFQDFVQYFLPAQDNIGVGDHARLADLDAVVAAAREAGADEFLSGLPDGYRTMLGRQFEGGAELSVGQWQRVALARALFRHAPLVILDEPTAALDPRAEDQLFRHIAKVARDSAVLLISHRFSSVRSAHRIFVLEKGKVIESGSHGELMAKQGVYAELFELQAAAYQPEAGSIPS